MIHTVKGFGVVNKAELPGVQAGFRKGRGTRDQIVNIHWILKKNNRIPEEHLSSVA